ncbi:DUF2500 domain-containing protein [Tissierella pigra]|uniref:DUF2500 domain-containing protein n=1 Tax=Tissierella pigra TaxID=2607614 RepID=A0A6N7XWB9_9FIRM|nr:DUF2500 domain-containing protein [Tissierella pigra]MBU5425606.1 DUF2500 domain-containing protein [Tissierella pigra]MSU00844.1 DUF2500 domain-containing protein [Tissierella pigra]
MYFSFIGLIVPIFFIVIFGIFIFTAVKGIGQWHSNNQQPVLTVAAKVVSKRTNVSRHNHTNDNNIHSTADTTYYATFEVESGDRMEFHISGKEYGKLAEGDIGKLTFQGTRYQNFERIKTSYEE